MASKLVLRQYIDLPFHPEGDFDHGDVYLPTGSIFIANTAAGTVEVVDGGMVVTLDTSTGSQLAQVPIAGTPDAIWHNHRLARLYVAIADPGMIDVANMETMTVEEHIQTELGAHTTAFDAKRERLYIFLPSCRVAVYEESEVP